MQMIMTWPLFTVGSLKLDVNNVSLLLKKHKFPAAKWQGLAAGLGQASAVQNIQANGGNVDSKLLALINHWVANDRKKSWEKLVEAMDLCEEAVKAEELAEAVGVPYPGAVLLPDTCNSVSHYIYR